MKNSLDKSFIKSIFGNKKFQSVVGNPPYVRIQNLDDDTRNLIKKHWKLIKGDTDIFIPFIELGIELIDENGKLGYITPNSYFTSYAGKI
ncbi:MAG: Eco57I restriction-modification methylase domain-containing protein [candidate division WOR-3 bacterium]